MNLAPNLSSMTQSFVYAAARTPFGRFGGALADVRPDDLASIAIKGILAKAPALDPNADRRGDLGVREPSRRG